MDTKLRREAKYWPSIEKWCVAYTAPEYGFISENSFNRDMATADKEALEGIAKRIKFAREMQAATDVSEVTVTI